VEVRDSRWNAESLDCATQEMVFAVSWTTRERLEGNLLPRMLVERDAWLNSLQEGRCWLFKIEKWVLLVYCLTYRRRFVCWRRKCYSWEKLVIGGIHKFDKIVTCWEVMWIVLQLSRQRVQVMTVRLSSVTFDLYPFFTSVIVAFSTVFPLVQIYEYFLGWIYFILTMKIVA